MKDRDDGKIIPFDRYRGRARRPKPATKKHSAELVAMMDTVTRDLHAAASSTLRIVFLARHDLGLDEL